jgi:carboxylate-amine ligase
LLCDGPRGAAWYEHRALAELLGVPALTPADLRLASGRLRARVEHGERPVEVIYRRTAEERLTGPDGRPNELGELLIEPIRSGAVSVVNAFGSGVADDKLAHAYVDAMIRFYLGTEPLLGSVPTYDLSEPAARAEVLERLGEMVVKSREGLGGADVRILSGADRVERDDVAAMIRRVPDQLIAQAEVQLSTHPTLSGDRLEPRRVDLRPFLFAGYGDYEMAAAALTRCARSVESMHVNSSQGGGGKDTWTLP